MTQMHADQVPVDEDVVRRLLRAQCPAYADLPVAPVAEHGTDHALFRLGDDLVVRLPVIAWADGQSELEATWLPRLAPSLPVRLSVPVFLGGPEPDGYPFRWSVNPWLPGRVPGPEELQDPGFARDLGRFVAALQTCDADGAGLFGSRGHPLSDPERDAATRAGLAACADLVDAPAALLVWDDARAADPWDRPPAWFHGDLLPGNLLVDGDGRLSAVLDWGPCGAGDPACELTVAWTTFDPETRRAFLAAVDPDPDTWRRGRGWAVSISAMGIPYYRDTVPAFAERGVRTIEQVLSDG